MLHLIIHSNISKGMYQSVKEKEKGAQKWTFHLISHEIIYDFTGDSRNDAFFIIEKEPLQFIYSV